MFHTTFPPATSILKEEGTLVKAVNYNDEMFIIEEVQLFQQRVEIKILRFSNLTVTWSHLTASFWQLSLYFDYW